MTVTEVSVVHIQANNKNWHFTHQTTNSVCDARRPGYVLWIIIGKPINIITIITINNIVVVAGGAIIIIITQLTIYMGPIWAPCGHLYGPHVGCQYGTQMGSATGLHMGPIWAAPYMYVCIWGSPDGTHVEPGCTPHLGPMLAAHMGPI
ncbi:hypothetical protein DPMN_063003 [Dreissena polymorpha]|uniref:Uncharacterized protein n=1 Tax=Dreissena polymorpha TaxID=45954 RepID=A0A9D4HI84_DREPO|nr:hypothetical protein DPMN_063003 [Dreissena polymorpha]